jgi:hypothetical protein
LALVLLFPVVGKLSQLHIRQFAAEAFDGVGRLRASVSIFIRFPHFELPWSSGGILDVAFFFCLVVYATRSESDYNILSLAS